MVWVLRVAAHGVRWTDPRHIPGTAQDSGLPAKIANAKNISEVMEHKAGRDWWRKNGDSIDVKFDLEHGSPHLRQLNSYLKETRPSDTMPAGGS